MFENIIFEKNVENLKIENSYLKFANCEFLTNITIHASNCRFTNCIFSEIEDTALTIENGSFCILDHCQIYENGSQNLLGCQIFVDDSKLDIKNSTIKNGVNSFGLEAKNSKIKINNVEFFKNQGCGLSLESCIFNIKHCGFEKNGQIDSDFSQILINDSKGIIQNSKIVNGINSNGLSITDKSKSSVINSEISNHSKNGAAVERDSKLFARNCKFFKNGNEFKETLQIWVDNSNLTIKDSLIAEGACGIYGQKNSYIYANSCKIENNFGAICIFEVSELKMNHCKIVNNSNKTPIWFEDSKAILTNSIIQNSSSKKTIFMDNMKLVEINNVILNTKDKEGIDIQNSQNVHTNFL